MGAAKFVINEDILVKYNPSPGETKIIIPDGVRKIGKEAISCAFELENVICPASLNSIGDLAFYKCCNLQAITFSSYVEIGYKAFMECSSLTDIDLSVATGVIGELAFAECSELRNVVLPGRLEGLGEKVFSNCEKLQRLTVGEGITEIPDSFAYSCTHLKAVELPCSLIKIGNSAFSGDILLKDINIPGNVTDIGECAFYYCANMSAVGRLDSVENIHRSAFEHCKKLQQAITFGPNIKSIGDYAFADTAITKVVLPNHRLDYGKAIFFNCDRLQTVQIPEGVTGIEESMFASTAIEKIGLPDTVNYIHFRAFSNCKKLREVRISSVEYTGFAKDSFIGCSKLEDLYVNPGCVKQCADLLSKTVLSFARHPEEIYKRSLKQQREIIEAIDTVFTKEKYHLFREILKENRIETLEFFSRESIVINKTHIDELIQMAQTINQETMNQATECVSFLMNWKNENVLRRARKKRKDNFELEGL